jgi:hypothetical protein
VAYAAPQAPSRSGSQIYILAEGGEVIERRIPTEAERFDAVRGIRPRARIVIEASTDSEWVARCLEALGHESSYELLRDGSVCKPQRVRHPRRPAAGAAAPVST